MALMRDEAGLRMLRSDGFTGRLPGDCSLPTWSENGYHRLQCVDYNDNDLYAGFSYCQPPSSSSAALDLTITKVAKTIATVSRLLLCARYKLNFVTE